VLRTISKQYRRWSSRVTTTVNLHQRYKDITQLCKRLFYRKENSMLQGQMTGVLQDAYPAPSNGAPSIWPKIGVWTAQIVVAVVLAQTLFFKFTYAPETQVIFANRGGRPAATAVGLVELLCVILLLVPRTAVFGALLSLFVISGAIFTHLTSLGIQVIDPATGEGDGGLLFGLALVVALGSTVVVALRWRQLPYLARWKGKV
jgi:uncharacterized membrane protein YphA (DoxX/SURF4 family)